MQWDHEEVRSVWRRPKPCRATYLADRIIVGRLFEYQFSKLIMHEAPNQVALVWLAGKKTDTRNEHIECQGAAGDQVPSNGCEASTNVVGIVQVKK